MSPDFPALFEILQSSAQLPTGVIRDSFARVFAGEWSAARISALLVALRMRGIDVGAVTEAAEAMREAMTPVRHNLPMTFDTCGTGGDSSGSINVSTAAAVVVAAAGVPVAKHGNRAATSLAGSADVLEKLGVPTDIAADRQHEVLERAGIAFLFAQVHHPAMKHVAPVRRDLGIRTIFNIMGPLCNPAGATHQLLGAYADDVRRTMAEALRNLGTRTAWVVHGEDGLDEVSPCGPTRVTQLRSGVLTELLVTPRMFGLEPIAREALRGGDASENAAAIHSILAGEAHPARAAIVLNAAAALVVARDLSPSAATTVADETLRSGKALAKLETWRAVANQVRSQ